MLTSNQFICMKEKEILDKMEGKKVICYGASSQYSVLHRYIDFEPWVEYVVDNNQSRWGEIFCGKRVESPHKLKEEKTGTFIVLITCKYFMDISRELDELGLIKNQDYINLFELFHLREMRQYVNAANHFISYIDMLPDMRNITPTITHQKIGIVVNAEAINFDVDFPYSLGLFLILKYKGYDVKLIVDELCGLGDVYIFQGFSSYCGEILEAVLDKLKKIIAEEDIIYVDSCGKLSLSDADEKECVRLAKVNAIWHKGRLLGNAAYMSEQEMTNAVIDVIRSQMMTQKAFFKENKFDTINASTGIHKKAGIYNHICSEYNIRLSTQDGDKAFQLMGADSPCCYGRDIIRAIKEKWFTENELQRLLSEGKETYSKRIYNTNSIRMKTLQEFSDVDKTEDMVFQAPRSENIESYDVVIPMNVMWDGAAVGNQTVFKDYEEWLVETIDYIVNILKKKVLIREHPAGTAWDSEKTPAYAIPTYIVDRFKDNEKFFYVSCRENLNLYQYIENAKLVIPWTSTVGVEAATMGKDVLVHTDVYYADSDFVLTAHDKKEYFEYIKEILVNQKSYIENNEEAHESALINLQVGMRRRIYSPFLLYNENYNWTDKAWLNMPFEELVATAGVQDILQIVVDNVPSNYIAVKRQWERDGIEA